MGIGLDQTAQELIVVIPAGFVLIFGLSRVVDWWDRKHGREAKR